MKLISGTTKSQEGAVKDRATGRLKSLHLVRRDAAGPDVGATSTMTSLDLPTANDLAGSSMLALSYRVSVWVPTVTNPPVRVPFEPVLFAEFEAALAGWTTGWSLRPGLTVGMWLSPTLGWVRDESRVYDVIVATRQDAELLTAQLYLYVAKHFDQEQVLVTVTPEYSTLFTKDEVNALRFAAGGSDEQDAA